MNKMLKSLLLLVCVIGLVLTFGCTMMQDLATPCHVDKKIVEYTGEQPTSYLPWPTLFDSQRLLDYADYTHDSIQQMHKNAMKADTLDYDFCTKSQTKYNDDATITKQKLFNPEGSVAMVLATLFGGTIGTFFINTPKKEQTV